MSNLSHKPLAALLLSLTTLLCLGCAVQSPTTTVKSVTVTEQTTSGARILVTVEVENPNNIALPIPKAFYRMSLQDAPTFKFTAVQAVTLPANGKQTLTFPASFPINPDEPLEGRHYNLAGCIFYRPPGEFRAILDQYHIALPFSNFFASGNIAESPASPAATAQPDTIQNAPTQAE